MPTLLQFGAGNIGRGFIAPTFAAAGWSVVFAEVDARRLEALRQRGSYRVIEVDGVSERIVTVERVSGIDARDQAQVRALVAICDLCATAVGIAALPGLGGVLAAGLAERETNGRGALDILVCENGLLAHAVLRDAILAAAPPERRAAFGGLVGTVRTSIGRMIPSASLSDELDIRVEPYCRLPVDAAGFISAPPAVPNLVPRRDFDLVVQQKLYLHNLTHACLAYAGHLHGYTTIPQCVSDPELADRVQRAGAEACAALAHAHGADAQQVATIVAECEALLAGLMRRYGNRMLNDPVSRVARDPWRKLAGDDRLVGAARLCLHHRLPADAISWHILAACRYTPAADEPRAAAWLALRDGGGVAAQLREVAGLLPGDPLVEDVLALDRSQAVPPSAAV